MFKLNQPSLAAIKAKFFIQTLATFSKRCDIKIFVTGRTGSGKTTLGNCLIGIHNLMPSSGHQDCTNEINFIKFPVGIEYFDLPGVCSDDRLENYNRAALGLEQVEEFPFVNSLAVTQYIENKASQKQIFSIDEYKKQQFKPDIIFYLIAPDKQFLRDDCLYLKALLNLHSQVIYVFNMFVDKGKYENQIASHQNISDVMDKITKVHADVLGTKNHPRIAKINCWTTEGIYELMKLCCEMLKGDNAKRFDKLLNSQNKKISNEFTYQVKFEIVKLLANIACEKPTGKSSDNQNLNQACDALWEFINLLLEREEDKTDALKQLIHTKIEELINKCTVRHYETVTRKKSKVIYKSVANFKTIYEQVPNYDRPIIEKSKIFWYEQKTITREIFDGYREEYSHTEYWEEETGEYRLVGTTYNCFSHSGICLLLTLAHVFTSDAVDKPYKEYKDLDRKYELIYKKISQRVRQLLKFTDELTEQDIRNMLEPNLDKIFDVSFKISCHL
jgi:GTP-binding protein EngB required for normal cell division